jgi:REP element-mobilizing transposase RayT
MPQSLVQNYQHIVFSTKGRYPFLRDSVIRGKMHAYLGGVCRNHDSPSLVIGGVDDHVHILCRLSKSISVVEFVRELKRDSSKWIKETGDEFQAFFWQGGYGAFSISPSHVEALRRYIESQEQHHRKETFQDEFRRLLQKYGVKWDEKYAWE